MSQHNRLLAALTPAAQSQVLSLARMVDLPRETMLAQSDEPDNYVHFLTAGVASFVVSANDGASAEIGMMGTEGMVGSVGLLGSYAPVSHCIMQMNGAGYRVAVQDMRRIFDGSAEVRQLILQSLQQQMLAVSQIAACNRLHNATERLSRWLLTASDRIGSDTVSLTQDSLSQMLGTRRTTVALVAGSLQRSGLIRYQRGNVRIVNREGLTDAACDCYTITRNMVDNLYSSPADRR